MKHDVDTEIHFSGLKSGVYDYDYVLDDNFFSEYKNEKILGGNVCFKVRLDKKERLLMFYFNFSGEVRTLCDRCLGELVWPMSGEQTLCVKFSDTEHSDDEDVVILPEKAYKINLASWMYEYVAVEMPIQCFHQDDENGIPTCDPEMMKYLTKEQHVEEDKEEIDPRWAALTKLKK
ncbi:MAG: DUF177 domain-containing protein [Bacteroidales bacterium]|nr:DUF177 domain-containing protein [Bacteroidales bacterium]